MSTAVFTNRLELDSVAAKALKGAAWLWFQGPFLDFLSFTQYLLPLAVLELYLRAQDRAGASGKSAMVTGLLVLTAAMGVGVFGATVGMWLSRI
jgi:hypothetical protein